MAKTYTFDLSLQGVTTNWGYVTNYNFNQTYGAACAGFERDGSNYRNFGCMMSGNISVIGTPSSIVLSFRCYSTDYHKVMKLAKKTGPGGTNYGYSNLRDTQDVPRGATSFTEDVTAYGICQYGYFIYQTDYNGYSNPNYFTTVTLTIVTDASDYSYTLAYDANGGSGAPSSQSGSNTSINPSYTFIISSTRPTRSGYNFLGWSTSDTAIIASYQPGDSITVSSSDTTTLYAVWEMANTIRIVNNSLLELYTVNIVNSSSGLDPYRVMVVNSNNELDIYT